MLPVVIKFKTKKHQYLKVRLSSQEIYMLAKKKNFSTNNVTLYYDLKLLRRIQKLKCYITNLSVTDVNVTFTLYDETIFKYCTYKV